MKRATWAIGAIFLAANVVTPSKPTKPKHWDAFVAQRERARKWDEENNMGS